MTNNKLKEKLLKDPILPFVSNITESDIDQMNEVSLSTFNKNIDDIGNSVVVRGLWEKGLNRKLSSIFINLIKNDDAYIALHQDGYTTVHVDKKDNIVINILDFFENDYNFENTLKDNNTREYTFYYSIIDNSVEDNGILINGRFDLDVLMMYISYENYKNYINENDDYDDNIDCFEISFEIFNKIHFNRYITEDYGNTTEDELDKVICKETKLLKSIFNKLNVDKINNIKNLYPNKI